MYKLIITLFAVISTVTLIGFMLPDKELESTDVAILDSGINSDNTVYEYDTFTGEESTEDTYNHGTIVYNILMESKDENQEVNVHDIKVLDEEGQGEVDNVCEGIEVAISQNVDLISMSFGFNDDQDGLRECMDEADENDILLVAASGDTLSEDTNHPAAFNNVLSIGAHDENGNIYSFSSTGSVDFLSPGVDVSAKDNQSRDRSVEGSSYAVPAFIARYISYHDEDTDFNQLNTDEMQQEEVELASDRSIPTIEYD